MSAWLNGNVCCSYALVSGIFDIVVVAAVLAVVFVQTVSQFYFHRLYIGTVAVVKVC